MKSRRKAAAAVTTTAKVPWRQSRIQDSPGSKTPQDPRAVNGRQQTMAMAEKAFL